MYDFVQISNAVGTLADDVRSTYARSEVNVTDVTTMLDVATSTTEGIQSGIDTFVLHGHRCITNI